MATSVPISQLYDHDLILDTKQLLPVRWFRPTGGRTNRSVGVLRLPPHYRNAPTGRYGPLPPRGMYGVGGVAEKPNSHSQLALAYYSETGGDHHANYGPTFNVARPPIIGDDSPVSGER